MMLYKANVTFAGIISMKKGEEKELQYSAALTDLLRCGYVSEVNNYTETEVTADETERSKSRKRKTGNKS